MRIFVKNDVLMTEFQAHIVDKAEEKERELRRLQRLERKRAQQRETNKHDLANFRLFHRDGVADWVRFNPCVDTETCDHCRKRAKTPIRIADLTINDLPPFAECVNEMRLLRGEQNFGCRCWASAVMKSAMR
jgi:hypothetical protein